MNIKVGMVNGIDLKSLVKINYFMQPFPLFMYHEY
jgi:hypothetical protein